MKKDLFANYKFYKDGGLNITEDGYDDFCTLADIVLSKHFSGYERQDKEDLKSIGILKTLELLKNGDFDVERSSLKNYCYTGMRNEMKNYIYRNSKDFPVDDEIMATNVDSINSSSLEDGSSALAEIPNKLLVSKLGRVPGYLQPVANSLILLGFQVEGVKYKEVKDYDEERVAFIQCLVIWEHLERCRL